MRNYLFTFLLLLVVPLTINAQSKITISGVVTDAEQEPLIGVTIMQKGTSTGTMTDLDGRFSLSVDENSALVVSYVGYAAQEIPVGTNTVFNIVLSDDKNFLDEVVVVGFGTQKRRDIVGAVSSVSSKEILSTGQTNVLQALQGSVPGLRIDNSASPDGEPTVRIRGLNSLTSSNNSPLYIVDGVPFTDMRALDPNDIQSIEVLKDASASAIYGSQAANGVLLITTKRGSSGKPTINASFSYAIQNPMNKLDLMNGEEYLAFKREVLRNRTGAETVTNEDLIAENLLTQSEYDQYMAGMEVDPYDMMLNSNAPVYEASVSVTGGDRAKYYVGANYMDRDGLIESTFFQRFSIRSNLDVEINKYIRLSNNTSIYQYKNSSLTSGDYGMSALYRLSPYSVMYNEDGTNAIDPMPDDKLYGNPLSDAYDVEKKDLTKGFTNLTTLSINIPGVQGLMAEGKYSFDYKSRRNERFAYTNTKEGQNGGKATRVHQENNRWYAEGLLSYKREFNKHNLDITAMASAESRNYETATLTGSDIKTADYLWYQPEAGLNPLQLSSGFNERSLIGLMFRANYNFSSRYYLTFTVRRDGFSGFSENQKYATFPSAAVAWRINEESFMKDYDFIDNLKLRASYGKIGSQGVDVYETLAKLNNSAAYIFSDDDGRLKEIGYAVSAIENNLKWETTTSTNVGLDFSFLKSRVFGSFEFYNNISDDLLVSRNVPIMMGVSSLRDNAAKVRNRGFEVNLTGSIIRTKDWEWQLGGTYSYNKNEILEIYGEKKDDVGNRWFIGQPIGVVYTQKCIGLWQEDEMGTEEAILYNAKPGMPKLEDVPDENGEIDYKITDADRQIIGTTVPPHLLGLRTSVTYKDFTLSVLANGAFGHVKKTTYKYYDNGRFRNFNFNYWTPENPNAEYPRPGVISGETESTHGSLFTYDADWFKIKNITLNYNVPVKFTQQIGINSLSVYCSLQDYFSFYSYPFVDPETGSGLGSYPSSKEFKFGVRLSF